MRITPDDEIRCGTCHAPMTWYMERHVDCADWRMTVVRDSCACGKPVVNDPTLPDGWRFLQAGERISSGDRYWCGPVCAWERIAPGSIYLEFDADLLSPHIRRISNA